MARILPTDVVPGFLEAYNVTEIAESCKPEQITVKIWDLYGTAPKDDSEATPTGQFIAAIVFCDDCEKSTQLHRAELEAVES